MKQGKVRVNIGSLDGYIGTSNENNFSVDVAVCNDGSGVILVDENKNQLSVEYSQIEELMENLRYAKENCRYNREHKQ